MSLVAAAIASAGSRVLISGMTLFVENGRLLDFPDRPQNWHDRKIAEIHQGDFRLTANQNIVANVPKESEKENRRHCACSWLNG